MASRRSKREEVAAYQSADIILLNGASYSSWVSHSSLPLFRTVDTSAPFRNQYIPIKEQGSHTHGPDGEHEHGKVALTTWLDPTRANVQAAAIRDALISQRPGEADFFNKGFEALSADGDYLSVMRDNVRRLSEAFSP